MLPRPGVDGKDRGSGRRAGTVADSPRPVILRRAAMFHAALRPLALTLILTLSLTWLEPALAGPDSPEAAIPAPAPADAGLQKVPRDDLQPGDLVFFNTMRRAFSHVGIYVGEGRFIHAPRSGGQVRVEDMRQAYWSKRFNGARRAALAETASPARP